MTTTVPEYIDAIGQKITPGDFVISIRDGTGAKPRMTLKFSPSKVLVSSSWYTDSSYMDACSLVVITTNLEKLIAEGHQESIDRVDNLKATFGSQIVTTAPKTAPVPLRWMVVGYSAGGPYTGDAVQFVSVHQVQGASQSAFLEGNTEAHTLATATSLSGTYAMNRTADNSTGYYSQYRAGPHWSYGNAGYKECLFSHKAMVEIGLDNAELNKLIPVAIFNSMVPPSHRITKV